jgi:hypothetical protein
MPVPDFSPGEVLTAGAMDSIGLWKIASGTLSLTTTPTNVTGVFGASYKNYRVLLNVTTRSVNPSRFDMKYLVGTTPTSANYYQSGIGSDYGANSVIYYQRSNNDAQFFFEASGFSAVYSFDVFNPNRAVQTAHHGSVTVGQQPYSYAVGGFNGATSQFTGFQLVTSTGTINMEYTVYGYRD